VVAICGIFYCHKNILVARDDLSIATLTIVVAIGGTLFYHYKYLVTIGGTIYCHTKRLVAIGGSFYCHDQCLVATTEPYWNMKRKYCHNDIKIKYDSFVHMK
jgi:hypothetical protein